MKTFKQFLNENVNHKLNEYGGDSIGSLGNITVNNIEVSTNYRAAINTPDYIEYELFFDTDPNILLKMGIWSDELISEELNIAVYFHASKTFSNKWCNNNSVRDLDDDQIVEEFENKLNMLKDTFTSSEFVKILNKNLDFNNGINDWRVLKPEEITQKNIELNNAKNMKEISSIIASITPKEAIAISKRKNMPDDKITKLQKLTKKKGEDLLNYIEDSI